VSTGALPGARRGRGRHGRHGGHRASRRADRRPPKATGHSESGRSGRGRDGGGHGGARRPAAGDAGTPLAGRLLASLACCFLAVAAVKENYPLRALEAALASRVVTLATGRAAGPVPATPTFWYTVAPHHEMALEITQACTVVLMTTPFLIATAFLVWRRSSALRPLLACAVAIVMLMVVNQLRILTIIMFVLHLGFGGGFYWGHTLIGSLITIIGGSVTLVAYVMIAIRRGSPARIPRSAG
jgi:exosortase/archaeosortase family protein